MILEKCKNCPLKDEPDTVCYVQVRRHSRFCQLIDPEDASYNQNAVRYIIEESSKINKKPSLLNKLKNFGEAVLTHIATGAEKASEQVIEHRKSVCSRCPLNQKGTCSKCGCNIEIKTSWLSSNCPLNMWNSNYINQEVIQESTRSGCGCNKGSTNA